MSIIFIITLNFIWRLASASIFQHYQTLNTSSFLGAKITIRHISGNNEILVVGSNNHLDVYNVSDHFYDVLQSEKFNTSLQAVDMTNDG